MTEAVYLARTCDEVCAYLDSDRDALPRAYQKLCTLLAEQFGLSRVAAHAQIDSRDPEVLWPHLETLLLQEMAERKVITIN